MRLFVGVPIPLELREKLQSVQKEFSFCLRGSFVAPENFHFTVKFLGDVREDMIPNICSSINIVLPNHSPFPVQLLGVGAFPSEKNPRVVWTGASENPAFVSLLTDVQRALDHFRKEDHKEVVSHLTLTRVRTVFDKPQLEKTFEKFRLFDFGSFIVDKIVLYQSDLGREGPIYTVVRELVFGE